MAGRKPSDIPVGTQFTPDLIDLKAFLQALIAHSSNRVALQNAIWSPPVHLKPPHGVPPSRRRANLPLEAAVQYGLLERMDYSVTELTIMLATVPQEDLYQEFARHILLNCGGLRVVEAVQQMRVDGRDVTADSLSQYLTDHGFHVTEHNTAINSLRMWLARAGVFSKRGWEVDIEAKEEMLGLSEEAVGILSGFNEEQRAYVVALCRVNPNRWTKAAEVRELAESTSGLHLARSSLPKEFLEPLREAGLIEYQTRGTAGGKSALLRTTDKFSREILDPFVTKTIADLDPAVTAYYIRRPGDIYRDLESSDTFRKGQALEAYAIHIMRLLGLRFLEWRKRAQSTGGAEVDVALAGLFGPIPTFWQVQCKNTPGSRLDVDHVSREVGVATLHRATHVMIIANCPITRDAMALAASINKGTTLTLYILDKSDFEAIKQSPGLLGRILRAKAEEILEQRIKGSM